MIRRAFISFRRQLPHRQSIEAHFKRGVEKTKELPIETARYSGRVIGTFGRSFFGTLFAPVGRAIRDTGHVLGHMSNTFVYPIVFIGGCVGTAAIGGYVWEWNRKRNNVKDNNYLK